METPPAPEVPKQTGSSLPPFFSHPLVGFIGTVVTIISLPLAFYFYFKSEHKPHIELLANPIRTPIVQSGKVTDIEVSLHGQRVTGDLTAAQFLVWNSGNASVRSENILKPLILISGSNYPIYEARIRNVSRDVIGVTLNTNQMAEGRLGIDWKILEEGDGCSIQVIYGGPPNVNFANEGFVEQQKNIGFKVAQEKNTLRNIAAVFWTIAFTFAYAANLLKVVREIIERRRAGTKFPATYYVVVGLVYAAMGLLLAVIFHYCLTLCFFGSVPPFEF